jgi:hypothetical protein
VNWVPSGNENSICPNSLTCPLALCAPAAPPFTVPETPPSTSTRIVKRPLSLPANVPSYSSEYASRQSIARPSQGNPPAGGFELDPSSSSEPQPVATITKHTNPTLHRTNIPRR